MRRRSLEVLFLTFLTSFIIRQSKGGYEYQECSRFYTEDSSFTLPADETCSLVSDIAADEVTVLGKMIMPYSQNVPINISCTSFRLEAGGLVSVDACGFEGGEGPGSGNADGSGGSYGGRGGSPANKLLTKNDSIPYGSFYEPIELGSGGGGSSAEVCNYGGTGGGSLIITATGTVEIDGILSANGDSAVASNCGGGSGGSILIKATHIEGGGVISSRGGNGYAGGGGGSGGRIALHHETHDFRAYLVADGGLAGAVAGYITINSKYASSTRSGYSPSYGLIDAHSSMGWRANTYSGAQYLEFRFVKTYVTSMEIKGAPSGYYVTSFNVRYYNDTTGTWVQVGDENYEFVGNTDYSTIVPVDFPWPLQTTRLRVYPKTYSGGIEMSMKLRGYTDGTSSTPTGIYKAASQGGPGGPGTVYFLQGDSPGIGRLTIDNYAKNPYIFKESSTTKEFDAMRQGGAAWVLDETDTLDEIVLYDGSQLVVNSDLKVSNVIGDPRSMLHIAPSSVFTLGHEMNTHCFVYEGAVFNLTTSSISIGEYLYVKGLFDCTTDAEVTLTKSAEVYFAPQDITISALTVAEQALLKVIRVDDEVFNLNLNRLEVHGTFDAGPTDLANITEFAVGTPGVVKFDPVDENEHLGQDIQIRGKVELEQPVSFKRPCELFLIDYGTLSWPVGTSTNITLECERVVINGQFSPGSVNFGVGIEELSVGNSGNFAFTAYGSVLVNGISVAGTMNVRNLLEVKSTNGTNNLINYVIVHSPNGKLYLNKDDKPAYDTDGAETNANCSILRVDHLLINGVLAAKSLDIADGIEDLYIDDHGEFTFTPCGDYKIHEIYVNGSMKSTTPLVLKGVNIEKVHSINIDTHGEIALDNNVLASKAWTGSSKLGVHDIQIAGTFNAGRMQNRIAEDGGFDSFSILRGGQFNFEPDGDFIADYISINGKFYAYKNINILTKRPEQDLKFHIGASGDVRFDSLVSSGWEDLSTVTAESLQTSAGSYFSAGDTKFDMDSMVIAGTLNVYPSEDISAKYFEVSSGGRVDLSRTVNINGQVMAIKGTLDVSYQHAPEVTTLGSNETLVTYDDITISGTFKAGSVHVVSETLSITGVLDVSGGGYTADNGPGAGRINSNGASGASHGSRGGRGQSLTEAEEPYGDIYTQSTWGSGGGSNVPNGKNGGRGGGYAHLYVRDTVTISGRISANGLNSGHSSAGGGSGGNIYAETTDFTLIGTLQCNGGSSSSKGGGGAGGRVTVYFTGDGNYHSGFVESKGGSTPSSTAESGGPGMMYVEGPSIKNLRVDNRCQQPKVTEPSGTTAGAAEYKTYTGKGATAALKAPTDDHTFEFTHIELYGGAHFWVNGVDARVETSRIYGDDTAHFHIGPGQILKITEKSEYRRANVTYEVYLYEGATWILPESILEFREVLDQKGLQMADSTYACTSGYLRQTASHLWGNVVGDKSHLLVSTGATVKFEDAGRLVKFVNVTIQDGGLLEFVSDYNRLDDRWELRVGAPLTAGMITVEAGGTLKARNLDIISDFLKIDKKAMVSVTGQGLMDGKGAGTGRAGGGYGGRGGGGSTSGEPGLIYGACSDTEIQFGSGGSSATTSSGAGGGAVVVHVQTLIVEGTMESNGAAGTGEGKGGGSGGSMYISTSTLEGSGVIQASGGNGGSNGGGGGGGRILIDYHDTKYWFGQFWAKGGSGYTPGGAGTVYLQDTRTDITNRTLLINNGGQTISSAKMSSSAFTSYENEGGRTWIPPAEELNEFESIRIFGNAHLALHPDLKSFELRSSKFEGDKTGTLHIGPGQTAVINHPDHMEFLVNIYVYAGGVLVLPPEFICYDISLHIWGTIGVYNLTVADKCHLYLGKTGTTKRSGFVGEEGVFDFQSLTVAAGGEVTATSDLVGVNNLVHLAGTDIRVQGGGIIHAIQVYIDPVNLIVDDLGEIIGDNHELSCDIGDGYSGSTGSGAGHGGRGGHGSSQSQTGAPYDCLIMPSHHGCRGGSATVSGSTVAGGRGGGFIHLIVSGSLQVDGQISCNGEAGRSGSGGGSGGSIIIEVDHIQGYGEIQVTGGDGSVSGSSTGGGGSGGMIALYFARNFTYSGSWDVYGGLGGNSAGNGASGMAYFYHTGHDHETLYINNVNRGPAGNTNTILDYGDLTKEEGHTWLLKCSSNNIPVKRRKRGAVEDNCNYEFHELQMYGRAHLAVDCGNDDANIYFHNMIGDRSGGLHVGPRQTLDLERPKIDLPFSVHVYNDGFLGMAPDTNIHGVDIFLNGTLAHIDNLTLHHGGNLWLYNNGRTEGEAPSTYEFDWVHVKDQGYIHMITDPVWETGINFTTIDLHIDGGGLVRGTHLYFHSVNITVDDGGILSADELGYSVEHVDTNEKGINGKINPGLGHSGAETGSGAGHGGSGGRGEYLDKGGRAYSDLYNPRAFGSAGGGVGGGRGGGNIWLNVTDTFHIDGNVTANGGDGQTVMAVNGGGGSGGSILIHCYRITGDGLIQTSGGWGSSGQTYIQEFIHTPTYYNTTCQTKRKCENGNCQDSTVCIQKSCPTCTTQVSSGFDTSGKYSYTLPSCDSDGNNCKIRTFYRANPPDFKHVDTETLNPPGTSYHQTVYKYCKDVEQCDADNDANEICHIAYKDCFYNYKTHSTSTSTSRFDYTTTDGVSVDTYQPERDEYITYFVDASGGGGGGGRMAMYFTNNRTFSGFRYLASGGLPGRECDGCEPGGPGTIFLYHNYHKHRTLIIDNDGAPNPREKYVNWVDTNQDGGRAWILPESGLHDLASGNNDSYLYQFEELQIYGNGHLAVMPPTEANTISANTIVTIPDPAVDIAEYDVVIFFTYMIGDRTGSVHVASRQVMDLLAENVREESDLPFNTYAYERAFLGLAPITFVHGVEIHMSGSLAHVRNLTLTHGGYLWLKHGGRTLGEAESKYRFEFMRIQDNSVVNATTDPIDEPGITFYMIALTIEGGGTFHGTFVTFLLTNITVDDGGVLSADGLGYTSVHDEATNGNVSQHGRVNPGKSTSERCGASHGGTGGRYHIDDNYVSGSAYGDMYEPDKMGCSGGPGTDGNAGGSGGGRLWFNITGTIDIDGIVSANGVSGVGVDSGGGSGGSIWMHCNTIKGYGRITAHGGDGNGPSACGGAGGRIAVYFKTNKTMSSFSYKAYGGWSGSDTYAEDGGGGTVFIYHMLEDHQTMIIDNGGRKPYQEYNIIKNYHDLTLDSCRTWIVPDSASNKFTGNFSFRFNELQMYGFAHLGIEPEASDTEVDLHFLYMIGDRTGTVHIGNKQVMDLQRPEIDTPFNIRVYAGGYVGLAPFTIVHDVTIWLFGEMNWVENITLHHGGHLSLEHGGFTSGEQGSHFDFLWMRIQDTATVSAITDPVSEGEMTISAISINMEGGSTFVGTYMNITVENITIDNGATMLADFLGYRTTDAMTDEINRGRGFDHVSGSSGGGHGGTGGWSHGHLLTGQPYGHLFEPREMGSSGGHSEGGRGGGLIELFVSNKLLVDGEIRANGEDSSGPKGGAGSGGSLMINCSILRGMGNFTTNGGSTYGNWYGSAGAGGRMAIYFNYNLTYHGTYQSHGGMSGIHGSQGGPGTVFMYNKVENHRTIYINNNNHQSTRDVNLIRNYSSIAEDTSKAWLLPSSADHAFADGKGGFNFEELQIYGKAHLAMMHHPLSSSASLYFRHMIGDRSGFVHIGPNQVMDLERNFIDTPFSTYIYEDGHLGLAPDTNLEMVFAHIEGTIGNIVNLTLINGGALRLFQTGSTEGNDRLQYVIPGETIIKAKSSINCSSPNAHDDEYDLRFGVVTVEGGGKIAGSHIKITADDFTVDDGGQVDVSNGGHLPGDGQGAGEWSVLGSSGASHGGLGGRGGCGGYVTCRLEKELPYGNLFNPDDFGSGGALSNGGTGGGKLHMEISRTLAVDGYIKANSYDTTSTTYNGASGGSAGSIYIKTFNFTGSHTGHIQTLGGAGDKTSGGGGAGGRISLTHGRHQSVPHFRGSFDVWGGAGAEPGASGTAFVEDFERDYRLLKVDNHDQERIAESTEIVNEGYRVDLSSPRNSFSKTTSYTTEKGHTVSSSRAIYHCYGIGCPYTNADHYYYLHYLFDQTLSPTHTQYFLAGGTTATVTIELSEELFINKLKIYPISYFSTYFKVIGYTAAGDSFPVTSDYVQPANPIQQAAYLDIPLMRKVKKFDLLLDSRGSNYVGLSEVEIYASGGNESDRFQHVQQEGAFTWALAKDGQEFDFTEVQIQGNAHLAFKAEKGDSEEITSIYAGNVTGDKTGWLHIAYNQEMRIVETDSDVPFNARVYEKGHIIYPPRAFFYKTKLFSSGKVSGLEDIFVFDGGEVSVDTNGSIATEHVPAKISLKSLHVQDKGTFELKAYQDHDHDVYTWSVDSTNITIYGGGHFKINSGLDLKVHHLLAVYSGGKINLDGAGYLPNTDETGPGVGIGSKSGGSGGGHGGSGGRGSSLGKVGQGCDSMYKPKQYGSHGGYGYYHGQLYFGDNKYGNRIVPMGLGGGGGGRLTLNSRHVDIDGHISVSGLVPDPRYSTGAGGGAGGSIWIVCEEIIGHGKMSANGGNGAGSYSNGGGGGGGGRISIKAANINKLNITLEAYGGTSPFETGGAGTAYVESISPTGGVLRLLTIDNNGHDYPKAAVISAGPLRHILDGIYDDISTVGGVTWLDQDNLTYHFDELNVRGKAQVAILSDTMNERVELHVDWLWGDKSGVLHIGRNQTGILTEVDVYLPTNIAAYKGSFLRIPDRVTMREVWAEINATMKGMDDITVENGGELYIWSYAQTEGKPAGEIHCTNISVKAGGKFEPLTAEDVMKLVVTRVVVNGNGYLRTNSLKLIAVNVTIDLSGDFHADFTGHAGGLGPGGGGNATDNWVGGGGGGGHGGRGGRSRGSYQSSEAYDSMYKPSQMGGGGGNSIHGNGGRGGGVMELHIEDELRVEGTLHSNGEKGGDSQAGGGAGGSILIYVFHLDGLGSIQAKGGSATYGGGGSGGRIAIYHRDANHFAGDFIVSGGKGYEHWGGAGTVYIEDQSGDTVLKYLTADNAGSQDSHRIVEVERVDLVGPAHDWNDQVFHSYGDVTVTSNVAPYRYWTGSTYLTYPLSNLFNKGKPNVGSVFASASPTGTLTFELPTKVYVEYLRIYPYCSTSRHNRGSWVTNYMVETSLEDGDLINRTDGYVSTASCRTQNEPDQFGTVWVTDNIDKIVLSLKSHASTISMSEIEIWVREDPTETEQTPYSNAPSAAYLLPKEDGSPIYTFDKLSIIGGASLHMVGRYTQLVAHEAIGDNSGRLTVRPAQVYFSTQKRIILEFSILAHRMSGSALPQVVNCRGIDVNIKGLLGHYNDTIDAEQLNFTSEGFFYPIQNWTINAQCNLTVDHFMPTTNVITHLDVKTYGKVSVVTENDALTTLKGSTLTVRSGALFFSNDLELSYDNVTIEPYGELSVAQGVPFNLQHDGLGPGVGNNGGSSGGGHGGNGGKGQSEATGGQGYGSFLNPTTFGKNGGHSTFPHLGGLGGGRLYLKVRHTLTVDGYLLATGGAWRSVEAGGGSGGSILMNVYTIDGSGYIDASGGSGYDGSYAAHAGGGGGGFIALYYKYNFFVGSCKNIGGPGGAHAEPGGAGPMYFHRIPDYDEAGQIPSHYYENRTLQVNNNGQEPVAPHRNLSSTYQNYAQATGVTFIRPGNYPDDVEAALPLITPETDITLENLQIYRSAQLAMVSSTNAEEYRNLVNLTVESMQGDRSGNLHIGYNHTLYIGTGELPTDVQLYQGSTTTLQGELRAAGVTVSVEGFIKEVVNITIVDGGSLKIYEMWNLEGIRIDVIRFFAFNVRNKGTIIMNNGVNQHHLIGKVMQIFPGGLFTAKNLKVDVDTLIVDVIAEMNANNNGFCNMEGPGHGEPIQGADGYMYASGGSHGGDGGAESSSHDSPSAYNSIIYPDMFGSAGGDADGTYKG